MARDAGVAQAEGASRGGPQTVALLRPGVWFWTAVSLLSVLVLAGVVGFAQRWQAGWTDRAAWGYYAATFSFLLSTAQTAPVVSMGLRLVGGRWRRPVCRAAELFALVGVVGLAWFIPLLWVIPPAQGRRTIWYGLSLAPHLWEIIALVGLVVCGLAFTYWASLPDMAAEAPGTKRQSFLRKIGFSWKGSVGQWRVLKASLLLVGAIYFLALIFVHSLIASDLGPGLVPGWVDALFPAYHLVTSLQAGTALVTVSLFLFRQWGGLKDYIGLDTFKGLGRLLLVLTLLWFYFWWSSFIVLWYGRRPEEQQVLQLLVAGPNRPFFMLSLSLSFVLPFLLLLFNPIRKSILGPPAVSVLILLGVLFDRIRLFTASFSVTETGEHLTTLPPLRLPDTIDILVMLGGLSLMALVYLLATRLVPVLSNWEIMEGNKLTVERTLGRRKVLMVGKPE